MRNDNQTPAAEGEDLSAALLCDSAPSHGEAPETQPGKNENTSEDESGGEISPSGGLARSFFKAGVNSFVSTGTNYFWENIKQFDPARCGGGNNLKWKHLVRWCDINDERLRFTHDSVSRKFMHGYHKGQELLNLVDDYMEGKQRCQDLTPMVAVEWKHLWWIVCGNRRLWVLKEFVRRQGFHGDWAGGVPRVQVIVHADPFDHLDRGNQLALWFKALEAMGSRNEGKSAHLRANKNRTHG